MNDEIIKDPNCDHDWSVHNDLSMDLVYCPKCNSAKRDKMLALDLFIKMVNKLDEKS